MKRSFIFLSLLAAMAPLFAVAKPRPIETLKDGTGERVLVLPVLCTGDGTGSFPLRMTPGNPVTNERIFDLVPTDKAGKIWELSTTDLQSGWKLKISANLLSSEYPLTLQVSKNGVTFETSTASDSHDVVLNVNLVGFESYVSCGFSE